MKVLEHGLTHQAAECEFCHAKLEFCEADINPKFLPDWWDEGPYIICPECERSFQVNRKAKWAGWRTGFVIEKSSE